MLKYYRIFSRLLSLQVAAVPYLYQGSKINLFQTNRGVLKYIDFTSA